MGASSRAPRRSRLGTSTYSLHAQEPMRMDLHDPAQATHLPRPHSATAHWLDVNHSAQAALETTHAALMGSQEEPGFCSRSGAGSTQWPLQQPAGNSAGSSQFLHQLHSSHAHTGQPGHDMYHQTSQVDPLELLTAATELPHAFAAAKMASDMVHQGHRRIPSDSLSTQHLLQITDEACSPTSGYPQGAHPIYSPRLHHEAGFESRILQRQASGPLQPHERPSPSQHDADWQGPPGSSEARTEGENGNLRLLKASKRASPPADHDEFSQPERKASGGPERRCHDRTEPGLAAERGIAGEPHGHVHSQGRSSLGRLKTANLHIARESLLAVGHEKP